MKAIIHFGEYFFDFENMYVYADFDLRKNHAGLDRGPARYPHSKPNLALIQFEEMKLIKGDLKVWDKHQSKWVNAFPHSVKRHEELMKIYHQYVFETKVLGVESVSYPNPYRSDK